MTESAIQSSERLRRIVRHAAHYLPAQGPIGVFVHHNTLHAFEDLPFEEAVIEAARKYGAEPYHSEGAYRQALETGRIRVEDIEAVVAREPNAPILAGGALDRRGLRWALLLHGPRPFGPANVRWHLREGDATRRLRADLDAETRSRVLDGALEAQAARSLAEVCAARLGPAPTPPPTPAARPRDGLLAACGRDLDEIVHPPLIRLASVFLDQGQAYWPMPSRESGFLNAAARLFAAADRTASPELDGLPSAARRILESGWDAEQVVERSLRAFGAREGEWSELVEAELLALPGWAGLFARLEAEPELAPYQPVRCSLMEFLAVRLTLAETAARAVAAAHGLGELAASWRNVPPAAHDEEAARWTAALRLADAAQLLGLSARVIGRLDERAFARLAAEVERFDGFERRRMLHLAYELRHERQVLEPLVLHRRAAPPAPPTAPAAQMLFCIDEREESIRRHIEEADPGVETFGTAGYFGVAVDYAGIDDAHGAPLCPIVVKPRHAVREQAAESDRDLHATRAARRRLWARMAFSSYASSRTLVRGALSAAGLGLLSLFPLAARLLAPLEYAKLRRALNALFFPVPRTELTLERDDERARALIGELQLGFSIEEQVERVASVLAPMGLTRRFARLVLVLGHGSTSLNNPLESAYDCGACGGRRGGPNARLFAAMANHPAVREGLAARGVFIPNDTWFVGGEHDSCSDDVLLFDLDRLPDTHASDLARVRAALDRARAWNALERSRRFEVFEDAGRPELALRHVEERSEHLAEPRPEYGHCTNAFCVVGRRATTRGLFLDRRAFLASYDPAADPDGELLAGTLAAITPVCAGINLEYYFSAVDNERYGCGTKLPHNVTALAGVMNGHASDLRTGLSLQMVELHEPVRVLFVVEAAPERLLAAARRAPVFLRLLENRWIRAATLDPDTGEAHIWRDGGFEPFDPRDAVLPTAESSVAWYANRADHLPIAQVGRCA